MKTVCIYHSVDLDGWMSAAIVKHWFNQQDVNNKRDKECNTINFVGYNYGQPIPDLSEYDKVIMCDISFPKEKMTELWATGENFVWIDHHISAIKEMGVPVNGLQKTNYAACELTWKYFFPNETMPEIVRLLGRYDCFGHKGTDEEQLVLKFQYGARNVISNYEDAYLHLNNNIKTGSGIEYCMPILDKGKAIYSYLCAEAKQTYAKAFPITFIEPTTDKKYLKPNVLRRFLCVNQERFNPVNFGIDYYKDGYDGFACFFYKDGKWNWSLYNDNGEVDCSVIAKHFGGGGHKGASGFILNNKKQFDLLNNKEYV